MALGTSAASLLALDPGHKSCSNGRTVLTCRVCAGNPPRGADCTQCQGFGFNIYPCPHCNRASTTSTSSNTHSSNPSRGSSVGSSVGRDPSRSNGGSGGEGGSGRGGNGYGGGIGIGTSRGR